MNQSYKCNIHAGRQNESFCSNATNKTLHKFQSYSFNYRKKKNDMILFHSTALTNERIASKCVTYRTYHVQP